MSKKALALGFGLGVLACAVAAGIWVITSAGGPRQWTNTPLRMTSPRCTVVLHTRTKGFFPPTEYEYALTLFSGETRFVLDIPDDTSGGDPLAVYVLELVPDTGDTLSLMLIDQKGHAAVLDLGAGRVCEFETCRDRLKNPRDTDFIERMVSEDWQLPLDIIEWRYVASFVRTRAAGWAVGCDGGQANRNSGRCE